MWMKGWVVKGGVEVVVVVTVVGVKVVEGEVCRCPAAGRRSPGWWGERRVVEKVVREGSGSGSRSGSGRRV
jgi:hypothetical protein